MSRVRKMRNAQAHQIDLAVQERLAQVRQRKPSGLAERLLAIGKDTAPRLPEPFSCADHDELLYDAQGLPR